VNGYFGIAFAVSPAKGIREAVSLTLYPAGAPRPGTSTINYGAGQTRANNAIVSLGAVGDIVIRCVQGSGTAHVVLDVNGYLQ